MPRKYEDEDEDKFGEEELTFDEEEMTPKKRAERALKEMEEEKVERRGRPKKETFEREEPPIREEEAEMKKKFGREEAAKPRFVAYHIAEKIGILDNKINKSIGEDLMTLIAGIKNDLDEIKKTVGV